VPGLSFFLQQFFNDVLRGDTAVIGAGDPEGVIAFHPPPTDQHVLQGVVERMAHVERPGDVGGRNDDGVGRSFGIRPRPKEAAPLPEGIPLGFGFFRLIDGGKFHTGSPDYHILRYFPN
jgi:hypothetical protein